MWPSDVRLYILRRGIRMLETAKKDIPPEVQEEIALRELGAALSDADYLDETTKSELLGDCMHRLGQIPLEHCVRCRRPIFTHKAKRVEGRFYCETCVTETSGSKAESP